MKTAEAVLRNLGSMHINTMLKHGANINKSVFTIRNEEKIYFDNKNVLYKRHSLL